MQLNTLKRENPNKKARQVGRGGTRGKLQAVVVKVRQLVLVTSAVHKCVIL
jgi:hypothetical protein